MIVMVIKISFLIANTMIVMATAVNPFSTCYCEESISYFNTNATGSHRKKAFLRAFLFGKYAMPNTLTRV
jgi:hypothetical protein